MSDNPTDLGPGQRRPMRDRPTNSAVLCLHYHRLGQLVQAALDVCDHFERGAYPDDVDFTALVEAGRRFREVNNA